MMKLSVVLATRNEEKNIGGCLESIKNIADEIVILDEDSSDRTREIARSFGARVYKVRHEEIFHVTKQKALDMASGDWILQLDADERVTNDLAEEIRRVISSSNEELLERKFDKRKYRLFMRHQRLIEKRDGKIGDDSNEVAAFFIPRVNYFVGKALVHAGEYPDGVIRLVRKGKARFPAKSVHEQIEIDGKVLWLRNDLVHYDVPTLRKYITRLNRYTDLHADELKKRGAPRNWGYLFYYSGLKTGWVFASLFIRHKGFLDGVRGFLWSAFSASHYPVAYYKYWNCEK
jgi:glycosyltransferase involved in cell wall biosynthesis